MIFLKYAEPHQLELGKKYKLSIQKLEKLSNRFKTNGLKNLGIYIFGYYLELVASLSNLFMKGLINTVKLCLVVFLLKTTQIP